MKKRILLPLGVLVIAAAYFLLRPAGPNKSVAVVPDRWTMLNPAGLHAADETIAEAITGQLAGHGKVPVTGWSTVRSLRDSPKSVPDVAKQLDAALVLTVSVRAEAGQFRVTALLVEPGTGRNRWSEDFYAQDLNAPGTVQKLAGTIAEDLETTLGYHH
jgi:TolB-like protein